MEFSENLVIKIKYGDSLKRLTASVTGNNLDVDITELRERIIVAFKLSPSADFILTYGDIDGDTVMLDDDTDLHDAAIKQKLNPLKVNVQLRSQSNAALSGEPKSNDSNPTRRSVLDDLSQIGSSVEVVRSPPHDVSKVHSTVTEKTGMNGPPAVKDFLSKLLPNAQRDARPSNVHSGSSLSPASGTKETTPTASKASKTAPASINGAKETMLEQIFDKEWFPCVKDGTNSNTNSYDKEWFPITKNAEEKTASNRQWKGKANMQLNASHKGPFYAPQPGPQLHSHASLDVPHYPRRFHPWGLPCMKDDEHKITLQACHFGISCDYCDTKIFFGARYKKDDHVLCSNCFARLGKPDEYANISFLAPSSMDRDFNSEIDNVQHASESSVTVITSNDRAAVDETRVPVIEPDTNTENRPNTFIPLKVSNPSNLKDRSRSGSLRESVAMLEAAIKDNKDIVLKELRQLYYEV